jgi:CDP-4-dehydro-6-deoxyglucose reductase, E3
MHKITLSSNATFTANADQSLIDAAQMSGIALPYSCRNGRCSTCKCRILGPSNILFDELGLSEKEKEDGWALACARSAMGDLNLEIQHLSNIKLPNSKILPAKIETLELVTDDIMKVTLRLPPTQKFDFLEGQYIDIIDYKGIKRSYSIANRCGEKKHIELHIKRIINGQMSDYWFKNAKINDLLRVKGPYGTFILRHDIQTNVIFLATGTGIAPVMAMIESIEKMPTNVRPKSVQLYWGARYEHDFYCHPKEILNELIYTPVLSLKNDNWSGKYGYIQDVLKKDIKNIQNVQIYACGSNAMIMSAKESLASLGISTKNFFSDAFIATG